MKKQRIRFICTIAFLWLSKLPIALACTPPDVAGSINGKTIFCVGEKATFKVPKINLATSYKWSFPSMTSIVSGLNTDSITVIFYGSSGTIRVQGINSCDTGISSTLNISVNQLPKLSLISPKKYCCDYGNIALGSSQFGSPTGGNWSCRQNTNLIVSNSFQTSLACSPLKSSIYTLRYTYQDPVTACSNSDSTHVTINPLPAIQLKNASYCQNLLEVSLKSQVLAPINLNTMTNVNWRLLKTLSKPRGGSLKASDIIYDKDPSLNVDFRLKVDTSTIDLGANSLDSLILELTIQDGAGCYNKDTATVYIHKTPILSLDTFKGICINTGFVNLSTLFGVNPKMGCWKAISKSGYSDSSNLIPGIKGCDTLITFKLSLYKGPGTYAMRYLLNTAGCSVESITKLQIYPRPNVSLSLRPNPNNSYYCESEKDIELLASPTGGIWTSSVNGAIINGTYLRPSLVDSANRNKWIFLTYSYKHVKTGCDTSKSISVFVQSLPRVQIVTPTIDTCHLDKMSFLLKAKYDFTSKISWVHSANPLKASFENNTQLSNKNPVLFTIQPTKDTISFLIITAFTEAEGVCPFTSDFMSIRIDTAECVSNPLQIIQSKTNFSNDLKVYPNPNKGSFVIEMNKKENYSIKIFTLVGELVLNQDADYFQTRTINHTLLNGTYLLVVEGKNGALMRSKISIDK